MNVFDFLIGPSFGKILDKVFPDPAAKAAAQLEVLKLQQQGEFKQLDAELQNNLAQGEVNKIEAADPSLFKSGWRPAVGWVGVFGLAYMVVLRPILPWLIITLGGTAVELPPIETNEIVALLSGILGLGGYRTIEKIRDKS
jgi:hypothetical protein